MSRLTAGSAALLAATAMTFGLAGCKDSSTSAAPAPTTTQATNPASDSDQTPPDDAGTTSAPSGSGGGEVCDDLQFITQLVGDLQQGKAPSDQQGTSARIGKWVGEVPADIQRPGQGVTGPIIIAMRHPDAGGEVSTTAVKQDVVELNAWHDKNC
jgi:hypothetical protein